MPSAGNTFGSSIAPASTPRPRVLTVILNWNRADMTVTCVEHVRALDHPPEILVVDNGSRDDSVARLRQRFEDIRLIPLATNSGFAAGMNAGMQVALDEGFDLVWLLNNDAFVTVDSLTTLIAALTADPGLVVVGPSLVYPDGRPQEAAARLRWADASFTIEDAEQFAADEGNERYLVGAALLIRVEALRKVGLFAPEFFAYMEEADLGMRLNTVGRPALVKEAVVVHVSGGTSGGYTSPFTQFLMYRNRWLCLVRNAPEGPWTARWLRYTAAALRVAEMHEVSGRPDVARAILAGVSAARAGRYGPPPSSLTEPAGLEARLGAHPTRYRRLLESAATLVEWLWPVWRPFSTSRTSSPRARR